MIAQSLMTKSGLSLHPVGIGTYGFGNYPMYSPGTGAEIAAVRYALELGQNHIDTAEAYANGGAERVVGKAIGQIHREDIFIASKLWKDHVASGAVRPAVMAMLKRLSTDYLDMLYIHAPWFDAPWREAVSQIDKLIDEGVVRYLGVSNFNVDRLREALVLSSHPIAANQMHYSYGHRSEVSLELKELCDHHNITLVAYMPLEQGSVLTQPAITEAALRYNTTPSQVVLAWLIGRGALPIPKALAKTHIEQNAAAHKLDFNLAISDI